MESIIFIAPPAAGKGTLSHMVEEKYHMPHISTGDLLRDAVKEDTKEAMELKEKMEAGLLISDEIILHLLEKRLMQPDCQNGYILDGFPRTIAQAEAYQAMLKKLGRSLGSVIYVDVDREIAKKRIVGRASCPSCKAVFNELIEEAKPVVAGICDKCGAHLMKRSDDNAETFAIRFDTYLKSTEPLVHYYEKQGVLSRISNNISKDLAFSELEKIMNGGN